MTILLQTDVALSNKTTYKIGGKAKYLLEPQSIAEIEEGLRKAGDESVPVLVLGRGSNMLISDQGWPGLVIDVSSRFNAIEWQEARAYCQSGALMHKVVMEMLTRDFRGFEKLGGIPGSVGGAIVMNAGAFGQAVSDCLVSIDFLDLTDNRVRSIDVPELKAGYRTTIFKSMHACILGAQFRFLPDSLNEAKNIFEEIIAKRKAKHPLDLPNCGSVFKNIPGTPASVLIEQCSLKGYRSGGAEVSCKHANFIVNRDHATAADVRHLIVHMQKTVYERSKILLDPEVVFVGEFEEPLYTCGQAQ